MELLESPKTTYLLEARLEILHEQSIEWLKEIAFWKDEIAFYYAFMLQHENNWVPEQFKDQLNLLEKEIIDLSGGELDDLQKVVEEHEHMLGLIVDKKIEVEQNYRLQHKQLSVRIIQFEKRFRSLKNDVFNIFKSAGK